MDGWDLVLLVAAAYLAVTALVRLMLRRRSQVLDDLQRQVREQQDRQAGGDDVPSRRIA